MKKRKATVRGRGTIEDCVKSKSQPETKVVGGHLFRWVGIGWVDEGPAFTEKVKVFTRDYRPFILGGDVHQPMAAEIAASGPYALGKGFSGYLIKSPKGKTFIAEATTGALVGPTLEEVRADIKAGKKSVMTKQVEQARELAARARTVSANEFWERLKA